MIRALLNLSFLFIAMVTALTPREANALGGAEPQFSPHLGRALDPRLSFRDEAGMTVTLSELLHGRPLLLVPVYYSCPNLCNLTLEHLSQSLSELGAQKVAGEETPVAVISIDPVDTPQRAAAKKRILASHISTPKQLESWRFLTADQATISQLLASLGIPFVDDEATHQFNHPSIAVALTPTGLISQYIYGMNFPAGELQAALAGAQDQRIGSPLTRFLIFCFHYDPRYSRYGREVTYSIQACGMLSMLGLGSFIVWLSRRQRPGFHRSRTT